MPLWYMPLSTLVYATFHFGTCHFPFWYMPLSILGYVDHMSIISKDIITNLKYPMKSVDSDLIDSRQSIRLLSTSISWRCSALAPGRAGPSRAQRPGRSSPGPARRPARLQMPP